MSTPTIPELEDAAKSIVRHAKTQGALSSLTIRLIREQVEAQYGLEKGSLSDKKYRNPLKVAIREAKDEPVSDNLQLTEKYFNKDADASDIPTKKRGNKRRRVDDAKDYKSAAIITCSDVEDTEMKSQTPFSIKDTSIEKEDNGSSPASKNTDKPAEGALNISNSSIPEGKNTQNSDNEMSLSDEPFQRKKRFKIQEQRTKTLTRRKKEKAGELNKDEATIKRLKSLVAACGVRKVWVKVFQDCNDSSQQIRKLKEILAELGMTGRLSLEQAKKIKEKRELAKELEDVQSFEQSIVRRKQTPPPHKHKIGLSDDESVEDGKYVRRKSRALQSITAFLDSQSDED